VIVRIMGEGRFEVPDAELAGIERLDAALVDALDRGDDAAFGTALAALVEAVRAHGTPLAADDFRTSALVVPHPGASLAEVQALLTEGA
jgi:hypothetical protein